ncbi:MAG: DUF502 domain-containing protein [Candidatus Omnitrophota bacterium]
MVRRIFIAGLATLVPIVITAYVIIGLFNFADGILGKFINKYLYKYLGHQVPGLGIIISIFIVFLFGILVKLSRMKMSGFFERMLLRMPLVKSVYFPVKKIVDFLFLTQPSRFRGVVLVEYPRCGIYSIGFVTNKDSSNFFKYDDKKLYSIFIPSSPSPLTGFTIFVSEESIVFLDITIEEAVKIIVSGGMAGPGTTT